jgi:hypothetical protein
MSVVARGRETLTETSLHGGAVHLALDLTFSALLTDDLSEIVERSVGSAILRHRDVDPILGGEREHELKLDREQVEWLRSQLDGVLANMPTISTDPEGGA